MQRAVDVRHHRARRRARHDARIVRAELDRVAARHGFAGQAPSRHETIPYEDVTGKGAKQISFSQVDIDTACKYAAEDADVTLRLHRALSPKLEAEPSAAIGLRGHRDAARAGARAHGADRRADRHGRAEAAEPASSRERMHELTEQAYATRRAGHFSLDSPKQLQAILFDELKLPAADEDAERPAVDERGSARSDRRTITRCRA